MKCDWRQSANRVKFCTSLTHSNSKSSRQPTYVIQVSLCVLHHECERDKFNWFLRLCLSQNCRGMKIGKTSLPMSEWIETSAIMMRARMSLLRIIYADRSLVVKSFHTTTFVPLRAHNRPYLLWLLRRGDQQCVVYLTDFRKVRNQIRSLRL